MQDVNELVTGERLQLLCDVSVGTPGDFIFHKSLPLDTKKFVIGEHDTDQRRVIQQAKLVFVYTHSLSKFFEHAWPLLLYPFVLVTHNSDHPVTSEFSTYLDDPKILAWYGANMFLEHRKTKALPCGLANTQWPHGSLETVANTQIKPWESRTTEVYVNFDVSTNHVLRFPIAQSLPRALLPEGKKGHAEYLADLANAKYVVSPPGNGFDTHRTYEALVMGCIPIVQDSVFFDHFPTLPLCRISDWSKLDLHQHTPPSYGDGCVDYSPLQMSYWKQRFRSVHQSQS